MSLHHKVWGVEKACAGQVGGEEWQNMPPPATPNTSTHAVLKQPELFFLFLLN